MKKILLTIVVIMSASTSMAQQTPGAVQEAAWYKGYLVTRLAKLNDPTPIEVRASIPADEQNPIYTIFESGPLGLRVQPDPVVDYAPGDVGYSSWWQSRLLMDWSARDIVQDPYTSAAEIEANLCPHEGFPAIGTCLSLGKSLIDVTVSTPRADFGPLNAQIIHAPPILNFCPPAP